MIQTILTALDRTVIERAERDAFAALKARAIAQGYEVDQDGAILGKNALTGETVRDVGKVERWAEVVETADGEFAIADPGDSVRDLPAGARKRQVGTKADAEGVLSEIRGDTVGGSR